MNMRVFLITLIVITVFIIAVSGRYYVTEINKITGAAYDVPYSPTDVSSSLQRSPGEPPMAGEGGGAGEGGKGVKGVSCDDGTIYEACSSNKPFFCDNGELIEKCDKCGCNLGFKCEISGKCVEAETCAEADGLCAFECPGGYVAAGILRLKKDCEEKFKEEIAEIVGSALIGSQIKIICCVPEELVVERGLADELTKEEREGFEEKEVCMDGTVYGECSKNLPFYCDYDGKLNELCTKCDCGEDKICNVMSNKCELATGEAKRESFLGSTGLSGSQGAIIAMFTSPLFSISRLSATPVASYDRGKGEIVVKIGGVGIVTGRDDETGKPRVDLSIS